jgi:tol-pal system protein YbgF
MLRRAVSGGVAQRFSGPGSGPEDLTTMRPTAFAVLLCGFCLSLAVGAQAQTSNDLRPLLDRLDRLERDMNMLQRQVYRGTSPGGAPVPMSPADTQAAVNSEVRFGQIDDQMRNITGQIEELTNGLAQLKRRLDTLQSDIDQRLTALEHGQGGSTATAGAAAATAADPRALAAAPPKGAGANPAEPASQSGVLGQIGGDKPAATPARAAAAPPPSGSTPQEQYNYAFGLLRQANYPAAEQSLRAFVQQHPNDPLAGNAQYWLGETYYVRQDYTNAAAVFAEGYQKYPKGGKAPDNLLKLGMALGQLGQKSDACRAFARLDRDFPGAPGNVKERAADEKKRLGC